MQKVIVSVKLRMPKAEGEAAAPSAKEGKGAPEAGGGAHARGGARKPGGAHQRGEHAARARADDCIIDDCFND